MVNLTKNNNSLLISSDLQIFPYQESKISVPLNSIYYVLDNSNYVSFKNVNDNTTIFAVSLNELQINGEQATRDNLITLFDSVANGSTSSGGGGGGSVSWNDITDKPSTFAPSEHSHTIAQVDGLQEALDGKQASGDYALKSEIPDVSDLATKAELANYATTASTANFITKDVNNLTNYETATVAQGKYATKTELNTKLSTDTYNADKATFALKSNFWSGTQQEYDAIETKDPDTFYFITEA